MDTTVRWLERALLIVGFGLAGYCGVLWAEAQYFQSLPVPVFAELPGDAGQAARRRAAAPDSAINRGSWLARLEAPSIGLSATVLEGSDDRTLSRAAGHIETTALPASPTGNVGIAGHRDTTFRPLRRVKIGDRMILKTTSGSFEYRVTDTTVVAPDAIHVLGPTPVPTLTLVTCYPFTFIGHAPKRFIVTAQRAQPSPGKAERSRSVE
jgi:sortase A